MRELLGALYPRGSQAERWMVEDSMELIKIEHMQEDREEMLSFLKGEVFHLTTKDVYESILVCGRVCNNKDGQFGINSSSGGR